MSSIFHARQFFTNAGHILDIYRAKKPIDFSPPFNPFFTVLFQGHDGSSVNPGGRKEKPVGEVQPAPRLKSPENVGGVTGGIPGTSGRPQKRSRPSQG